MMSNNEVRAAEILSGSVKLYGRVKSLGHRVLGMCYLYALLCLQSHDGR